MHLDEWNWRSRGEMADRLFTLMMANMRSAGECLSIVMATARIERRSQVNEALIAVHRTEKKLSKVAEKVGSMGDLIDVETIEMLMHTLEETADLLHDISHLK